jgi:hypothetical protein
MPVGRCKDHDEDDDDGNHWCDVTPPPLGFPGKGIRPRPTLHNHWFAPFTVIGFGKRKGNVGEERRHNNDDGEELSGSS